MNKSELINHIAQQLEGTTKAQSARFVNAFIETVKGSLAQGETITIPGFGSFTISNRAARMGRDPKSGKPIKIPAKRIAKFRAGKDLKEAVSKN